MPNCEITLFFENHEELHNRKAIINLASFFKQQGYKTIAMELHSKIDPKEDYKRTKELSEKAKAQDVEISPYIKVKLELYKKYFKNGFSFKHVDQDNEELKILENNFETLQKTLGYEINQYIINFPKKEFEQLKPQETRKKIFDMATHDEFILTLWKQAFNHDFTKSRDTIFAQKISDICEDTNAGIVGLFGYAHTGVIAELNKLGLNNVRSFSILEIPTNGKGIHAALLEHNLPVVINEIFRSSSTEVILSDKYTSNQLVKHLTQSILSGHTNDNFHDGETL